MERWLSPARLQVYVSAAAGDLERALALYEWNAEICAALLHDLAHLEVGLRNAYDAAIESHSSFPAHWTLCGPQLFASVLRTKKRFDPVTRRRKSVRVDINEKPRKSLERAIAEAGGRGAPPGKIIAQLMFGFWRYLSSSAHEVTLWRPYLHHAFPPGTARHDVDFRVGELHELRNRVAHHEPVLTVNIASKHQSLLELSGLLEPELEAHVRATSRLPALIANRPAASRGGGPADSTRDR